MRGRWIIIGVLVLSAMGLAYSAGRSTGSTQPIQPAPSPTYTLATDVCYEWTLIRRYSRSSVLNDSDYKTQIQMLADATNPNQPEYTTIQNLARVMHGQTYSTGKLGQDRADALRDMNYLCRDELAAEREGAQ